MPSRHKSLAELIAARGWTPYTVAREAGLSVNTVRRWCEGAGRPWRAKAERLAQVLGVTAADVILAATRGAMVPAGTAS